MKKRPNNLLDLNLRPAQQNESDLFYALSKEQDEKMGTIGHLRIDFGRSGNEFWSTWFPRGREELNSADFKSEFDCVVNTLRTSVLRSRSDMARYCKDNGGIIPGGWTQCYGYVFQTEHYKYYLRCIPVVGDYNAYLTAFDLHAGN